MIRTYLRLIAALFLIVPMLFVTSAQAAESCSTAPEMDANARAGVEAAAQQLFSAAAAGNTAAMQQNSIAGIANNFQGIANVVQANKDKIAGGRATIRNEWILDAPGTQNYERAEFYCGTFNSLQRSSFVIPG